MFGEDPTVAALEARVADLLGHEAGLFTPSGSMANQLGLRLHVAPGRGAGLRLAWRTSLRAELGAAAVFSGITVAVLGGRRAGCSTAAEPLALMITGAGAYQVDTALVVVENTHNFGGGTVQPLDADPRSCARRPASVGVAHAPGRRPAVERPRGSRASRCATTAREFDTVSVCLSKGLGAPVGSVLVGSARRRWPRRGSGASATAAGCARSASSPPPGCTRWTTTSSGCADDHARARRAAAAVRRGGARLPSTRPGRDQHRRRSTSAAAGWTGAGFVAAAARRRACGSTPWGPVRCGWSGTSTSTTPATDVAIDVVSGLLRSGPSVTAA